MPETTKSTNRINISLDEADRERLKRIAEHRRTSVSSWIRQAAIQEEEKIAREIRKKSKECD